MCVYLCVFHYREHDKGPEDFCSVLMKLLEAGFEFHVSILGSHTNDIPCEQPMFIGTMSAE